jgi:hypothetical protein
MKFSPIRFVLFKVIRLTHRVMLLCPAYFMRVPFIIGWRHIDVFGLAGLVLTAACFGLARFLASVFEIEILHPNRLVAVIAFGIAILRYHALMRDSRPGEVFSKIIGAFILPLAIVQIFMPLLNLDFQWSMFSRWNEFQQLFQSVSEQQGLTKIPIKGFAFAAIVVFSPDFALFIQKFDKKSPSLDAEAKLSHVCEEGRPCFKTGLYGSSVTSL